MQAVWAVQGALAVIFTAGLFPLALLPLVNGVYRNFGRFAGWPAVVAFSSLAMGCALVAFTLFPLPDVATMACGGLRAVDRVQRNPFASIDDIAAAVRSDGVPGFLASGAFLQVFFNVVLFMPIGFLAHQILRRHPVAGAIGLGVALTVAVELTQGTAVFGVYPCPYRLADVDDLITNTVGTVLGVGVSALLSRRVGFMSLAPFADLDLPSLRRRVAASMLDSVAFVVFGVSFAVAVTALVAVSTDVDVVGDPVFRWARFALQGPVAALVLGLVVPLVRRDGATPGQASVDVRPESATPAQLVRRWVVRWGPLVVLPVFWPAVFMPFVELLVAVRRRDRASLAGLVGGTTTVTTRSWAASLANVDGRSEGE